MKVRVKGHLMKVKGRGSKVRVRGHLRRTTRSIKQDRARRSKQRWKRGRGARKIGNPRYKPVRRNGRKVYVVR